MRLFEKASAFTRYWINFPVDLLFEINTGILSHQTRTLRLHQNKQKIKEKVMMISKSYLDHPFCILQSYGIKSIYHQIFILLSVSLQ